MKLKHLVIVLMVTGLVALLALGCNRPNRIVEHLPPAYVRFLNAMIPEGSDTVSCYVLLDGQTVFWNGPWRIGSTSPRQEVADGRHRIQVTDYPPGVEGARELLNADMQFDPARGYTCLLTGTIPDSGYDSDATALLVLDDLYRSQNHVGIRLVNAGIPFDSCRLTSGTNPDTLIVGPIGHLQSSGYVTLTPGDYHLSVRQSADSIRLVVDSSTTASWTAYYIGTPKYSALPRAPHGVFLTP